MRQSCLCSRKRCGYATSTAGHRGVALRRRHNVRVCALAGKQQKQTLDVAIVAPVYNEQDGVHALANAIRSAMDDASLAYKLVLVDDGSTDKSADAMRDVVQANDETVHAVYLRRNSGQSTATAAGLSAALALEPHAIVTMDADLQQDPADIPALLNALHDDNVDAACGWRRGRASGDGVVRVFISAVANWMLRVAVRSPQIKDSGCALRAYRPWIAEYLSACLPGTEWHRLIPYLVVVEGGRLAHVPVTHRERSTGTSKYTVFGRMPKVASDLVTLAYLVRFRHKPTYLLTPLAMCVALSFLASSWAVAARCPCWPLFVGVSVAALGVALSALLFAAGVQLEKPLERGSTRRAV